MVTTAKLSTNPTMTTDICVYCDKPITLNSNFPRPLGKPGIWYHEDRLDVDCDGESCGLDDGEETKAEPRLIPPPGIKLFTFYRRR